MSEGIRPTSAVLLLGFGGPESLDAIGPFMTNLMGTEPSPEQLDEVTQRYLAIGGASPLLPIADSIAKSLEAKLAEMDAPAPVAIGMRYWHPFISQTLRGMHAYGIRRVVTVSLSPFDSPHSTGAYREIIDQVAGELPGLEVVEAPPLRNLEAFKGLLVIGLVEALTELKDHKPLLTIFTAHSLPVAEGCGEYEGQLREIVDGITETLRMPVGEELDGSHDMLKGVTAYGNLRDPQPWVLAFQSRGGRGDEWLEPDLDAVLDAAIAGGYASVAISPIGFATDHMETLFDLDVLAQDRVLKADVEYTRAPLPNDDDVLIEGVAEAVKPLLIEDPVKH